LTCSQALQRELQHQNQETRVQLQEMMERQFENDRTIKDYERFEGDFL